jgi:DNA-binding NarL/FixJ family response regulator
VTNFNGIASDQQWPRGLNRRESEVVLLVGTGISNKEIARQLGLSVGTVKQHVHSIFQKTAQEVVAALLCKWPREGAARNL